MLKDRKAEMEQSKTNKDLYETIGLIWEEMRKMNLEIQSLRTDVDKLIENSCGCKKPA